MLKSPVPVVKPLFMSVHPGFLYAFLAFFAWGILPLYWKQLSAVPAFEILCHRMAWSGVAILLLLAASRRLSIVNAVLKNPRASLLFCLTGLLIGSNWLLFIWAVNSGHVIEASLGYFMAPLMNVLIGRLVLQERLFPFQKAAVAFAVLGVLILTIQHGAFPWIAFTLAVSFTLYGLIRKTASAGPLEGLFVETAILFLPAVLFIVHLERNQTGSLLGGDLITRLLLLGAGPVTVLPLLWYAAGARRLQFSTLGILQYLAPTLQFLLAVFVFHEPFSATRLSAFICIWIGLVMYSVDTMLRHRSNTRLLHKTASVEI